MPDRSDQDFGQLNLGAENDQSARRVLKGPWLQICRAAGVIMSLLHLYAFGYRIIISGVLYAYHLLFGLFLIFILFKPSPKRRESVGIFDVLLAALSVATTVYTTIGHEVFVLRVQTLPNRLDLVFGAVLVLLVLEAARRTTGYGLPAVATTGILYALLGGYIPGALGHRGYDLERVIGYAYSEQGIFGASLGVSATYVYLFILFAAFLQVSGADRFFRDISFALAGGLRGGPAKIAIVSSGFFGTISGSAVANVVGTGTFTIPLMKSLGYSPVFAGAVEAVASTGGQIMPPIMGAAAFIVADIVGVPYLKVCLAATIPALLYYYGLFVMVDMRAIKSNIRGLSRADLPVAREVLAKGFHLLLPVAVLLYALMGLKATPMKAAIWAIGATILASMFEKASRMTPAKIYSALAQGAFSSLEVIAACAAAGLVVGTLSLTGLGLKLSGLIINASGGQLWLTLVLAALVCLVLGMGLPTTAAYIISASAIAPAIVKLGVPPLVAHLFTFYFACISAITPPVAVASYAAAGISKASPSAVGWAAVKLGAVAFIVPFAFTYGPALLMLGTPLEIVWAAVSAIVGVTALAASIEGVLFGEVPVLGRVLLFAGSLFLIKPGLSTDLIGFGLIAIALIWRAVALKSKATAGARA